MLGELQLIEIKGLADVFRNQREVGRGLMSKLVAHDNHLDLVEYNVTKLNYRLIYFC